ncbi:MAG TPA: exodeoxyribonuclease VII large subunit [Chloroflexota bacterium]|nr:exodeoxyribonuclease VII large subunit [Chloroflexota bacterium]
MLEAAARGPARPIHVSELTRYVKYLLENDELLAALSVQGEICELSHSAAGHVYFTLKDAGSQVPCVMLRRQALQQRDQIAALRKGLSVVVHGSMTVYEVRGSYQIYAERVVSLGEGAFAQRFQALRDKLEREGLFAPERKRPLPTHPRKIALVTSPRSQAYHDVLHRLGTQYPFVTVIEAGVSVQGDGAADEIVMALDIINRLTDAELILLVRGGGSPEDLAAFNDERLARAIYASRTPVVTGIGHETDHTIADFVADRRAATPSLAASEAVPDVRVSVRRLAELHREMTVSVQRQIGDRRRSWVHVNRSLLQASPQHRLQVRRGRAEELNKAARAAVVAHFRARRITLDGLVAQLGALDPLSILSRGYAVLTDVETGKVVSSVANAYPGQELRGRVADGEIAVRVEGS